MERDESAFRGQVKRIAGILREKDSIAVIHHYDADGMASAGILGKALQRAGKQAKFKAVKQLYSETFQEIKGLGEFYLFADFGSSYIPELRQAFGSEFVVIDHHQPKSLERERHLNPWLFGIDGGTEISGAGLCYLVAKELDDGNADLGALAVVGAVGDMQDSRGKLGGLNAGIVEEAVEAGVLGKKDDLRLFGRITRPLTQFLLYASSPVLPDLTANQEACQEFLREQGIPLKDAGNWRSYEDLGEEEKKKLATALILHLQKFNTPEWKIKELVGEVYTLLKEDPKSPLRDAKEFSTLLNASGRHGMAEIGLRVCLGDRGKYYHKALNLLLEHRRKLREGIELMLEEGVEEMESFHYFDAGNRIQDSLVGIVAGMLYGSGAISPGKPIIALARHEDGSIKVSARGTRELVRRGLNLGKALKETCAELGEKSEGGGHCLHPDSIILMADGSLRTLNEVEIGDKVVCAYLSSFEQSVGKVTKKMKKIVLDGLRIKTNVFDITCSKDHHFFQIDESLNVREIKAGEIKERSLIMALPVFSLGNRGKNTLSGDYCEFLGYFVGDGSQYAKKCLEFKEENLQLLKHYSGIVKREFGLNAVIKPVKGKNCYKMRVYSAGLFRELLGKNPLLYNTSHGAQVPVEILKSNRHAGNHFVRGLFDADGCVGHHETHVDSVSLKLLKQVQMLLMKSGILSSIRATRIKGNSNGERLIHRLSVSDFISLSLFLKLIGSNSKKKQKKLKTIFAGLKRKKRSENARLVPIKPGQLFKLGTNAGFRTRELFDLSINKGNRQSYITKRTLEKFNNKLRKKIKEYESLDNDSTDLMRKKLNISKATIIRNFGYSTSRHPQIKKFLLNFRNECLSNAKGLMNSLSKLESKEIMFCRVQKIQEIGKKIEMIDLSVPGNKNFIADGLMVHNSIAAGCRISEEEREKFLEALSGKIKEQLNYT